MPSSTTFAFARRVLALDAVTCLAAGALMAGAHNALGQAAGLPAPLLLAAGLSLFPVAALFAWMAKTARLNRSLVKTAVAGNALWIAASIGILAITEPNALGVSFVLGQAAAVAMLAIAEAASLHPAQHANP